MKELTQGSQRTSPPASPVDWERELSRKGARVGRDGEIEKKACTKHDYLMIKVLP